MRTYQRITLITAALVFILASYSFATVTAAQKVYVLADGQYMLEMIATANSTGTVATATAIDGLVYLVETQPLSSAPTDNYDLTLTTPATEGALDIMGGNLANRSATLTQRASPLNYQAQSVKGKLNLNVTNNLVAPAKFAVRIFYFR